MAERGAGAPLPLSVASEAVEAPRRRREPAEEVARAAVGFTASGLRRLGLRRSELLTFPAEFRDGPHRRSAFLGDTDANGPETWIPALAADAAARLHAVLGVWERKGHEDRHDEGQLLEDNGFTVLAELRGHVMDGNREPFGFRDGVGQPVIAGIEWCSDTLRRIKHGEHPAPERIVPVGEFVLGLPGELGDISRWRVPGLAAREEERVGYHGSFAALRVMRQDVAAFARWKAAFGHDGEWKAAEARRTDPGRAPTAAGWPHRWQGRPQRAQRELRLRR